MKLLVLAGRRPEKVEVPLANMPSVEIIAPEPDFSFAYLPLLLVQSIRSIFQSLPDAILVNADGPIGLCGVLLSKVFSVPLVIRLGGDTWETCRKERKSAFHRREISRVLHYVILALANRLLFNFVTGVVVVSEHLKNRVIEETSLSPDRVHVANTFIDAKSVQQKVSNYELNRGKKHVLTVTNLSFYQKFTGAKTAVTAVDELLSSRDDVEYTIVGGGPYLSDLKNFIEYRTESSEQIRAVGYLDNVIKLYARSDVLLYISYIDGYPNVILEAQAAGLPVIANNDFGMAEQISNKETGILVNDLQKEEIAEAVSKLLDSRNEQLRLGEKGLEKVLQENNVTKAGEELIDAVKSSLDQHAL